MGIATTTYEVRISRIVHDELTGTIEVEAPTGDMEAVKRLAFEAYHRDDPYMEYSSEVDSEPIVIDQIRDLDDPDANPLTDIGAYEDGTRYSDFRHGYIEMRSNEVAVPRALIEVLRYTWERCDNLHTAVAALIGLIGPKVAS